jgi:hypothetical protein
VQNIVDPTFDGNKFCYDDFGGTDQTWGAWIYAGIKSQANCNATQYRGVCKQDPTRNGWRYQLNCAAPSAIDAGGDQWCVNDLGAGWIYTHVHEQAGCTSGLARGLCRPGELKKITNLPMKNCSLWNTVNANGAQWCKDDYGPGATYDGQTSIKSFDCGGLFKGTCSGVAFQ